MSRQAPASSDAGAAPPGWPAHPRRVHSGTARCLRPRNPPPEFHHACVQSRDARTRSASARTTSCMSRRSSNPAGRSIPASRKILRLPDGTPDGRGPRIADQWQAEFDREFALQAGGVHAHQRRDLGVRQCRLISARRAGRSSSFRSAGRRDRSSQLIMVSRDRACDEGTPGMRPR